MMDEPGLQSRQNIYELFRRQMMLRLGWINRSERFLDQLAGKFAQREHAWPGGIDKQLAVVQVFTPDFFIDIRVKKDRVHFKRPPIKVRYQSERKLNCLRTDVSDESNSSIESLAPLTVGSAQASVAAAC
jgi:hypothetical protein